MARYLILRAAAFVLLTAASSAVMALPYLLSQERADAIAAPAVDGAAGHALEADPPARLALAPRPALD